MLAYRDENVLAQTQPSRVSVSFEFLLFNFFKLVTSNYIFNAKNTGDLFLEYVVIKMDKF